MTRHVSLAVIGAGSGNAIVPSDDTAGEVALFEEGPLGGTCINRGCIPSKMLVYTADVATGIRSSERFGIGSTLDSVDWPAIRDRVFDRIDGIAADGRQFRDGQPHVTLYPEHVRFAGAHELVTASGERVTADTVVVATGSRPVIPGPVGDSGVPYLTSDDVMRMDRLPTSMLILGGGYIAVEQAHIFSALGVRVTIVEAADRLLATQDETIAERFTTIAAKRWEVLTDAAVNRFDVVGGDVVATTEDGRSARGAVLLVATGRRPNTDRLDLDRAGIELDGSGHIVVDRHGRAAEGVWALGDCIGTPPLKHVANAEARTVAHNLAHPDDLRPLPGDDVPAAVFSDPQVASVGARRQDLTGTRFVEACRPFSDTAYGWALQDEEGCCQLYADPSTGLLLGAHVLGYQASLLITPLIQAITHRQRVADLARGQYWIHPALSEVVEQALLALDVPDDVRSGQVH